MEAYLKLNWRISDFSLLTSDEFIPEDSVNNSYIFKGIDHLIDVDIAPVDDDDYIPGLKYFKVIKQRSILTKAQQQDCLHALLLMTNSNEKLNTYDRSTLELYNRLRQQISAENLRYSQHSREEWNKFKRTYKIPKALTTYTKDIWKTNLLSVKEYPAKYNLIEAISISYDPGGANAEMTLQQNIFDLGHVAKYMHPIFDEQHFLKDVSFPIQEENNVYFKNKVSEDRNIDQIVDKYPIDIVISSGGFKMLMEVHDVGINWNIPVTVRAHNGRNVAFIDEPLRCPNPSKLAVNRKAYKDAIKVRFCNHKGFSYDSEGYTIKELDSQSENIERDDTIFENVSYKIWSLTQSCERNELLKSQPNGKAMNILIRSKIDACELLSGGKLQPVTIVPKLEYQLSFGGSVCSKSELINQWCSLFIRPQSILYRVRIHPDTSEVVMIEACNLQKINHEAQNLYNLRPSNGLQVLYKTFQKFSTLQCGRYLLHHTVADGVFVSLLGETTLTAGNIYNLHEEYKTDKVTVEMPKNHPWLAIDCNLVLPAHKQLNVMPGMFAGTTDCKNKRSFQQNKGRPKGKMQRQGIKQLNQRNLRKPKTNKSLIPPKNSKQKKEK